MSELKIITDDRGILIPLEFKDLPFFPQRLFIVKSVPIGTKRGGHAHYNTQQILICLKGKIKVILHDGLQEFVSYITENETKFIDSLIWDTQEFTSGQDVMLVLCSTPYEEQDYIRDFQEFKKYALHKKYKHRSLWE